MVTTAQAWTYEDAAHRYERAGRAVPSVTQVLAELGFSNYAIVEQTNPLALERKRQIGKLVHQAAHFYDEDSRTMPADVMELWESKLPEVVRLRLQGYKKFRKDTDYTPVINEGRYVFELFGMPFGGQFDSIGTIGRRWALVDIKNASGMGQRSWGLQTCAYEEGIKGAIRAGHFPFALTPEQTRGILTSPMLRIIPQLFDDGTCKLHTSDDPQSKVFYPEDLRVWQSALCISLDKRNHEGK
jgi:hypothetical protein